MVHIEQKIIILHFHGFDLIIFIIKNLIFPKQIKLSLLTDHTND